MERYSLLLRAIVVLTLAVTAHITGSDPLTAAAPPTECIACFIQDDLCEGNQNTACQIACGTNAIGSCQEYRPGEVECETEETVYEWTYCEGIS